MQTSCICVCVSKVNLARRWTPVACGFWWREAAGCVKKCRERRWPRPLLSSIHWLSLKVLTRCFQSDALCSSRSVPTHPAYNSPALAHLCPRGGRERERMRGGGRRRSVDGWMRYEEFVRSHKERTGTNGISLMLIVFPRKEWDWKHMNFWIYFFLGKIDPNNLICVSSRVSENISTVSQIVIRSARIPVSNRTLRHLNINIAHRIWQNCYSVLFTFI